MTSSTDVGGVLHVDDVTVVDTASGRLSPHVSVRIESGFITDVTTAAQLACDTSARRVDAAGKYLVPGFNDMHMHALQSADPSGELALMLANGITGMRQMAGSSELLARRRAGTLPIGDEAPELLAMPGDILTPANAATPEQASATIGRQREEGADFLKFILLPPPMLFPALRAATRLGMLVAGHLQNGVHPVRASRAGFRCVEHLGTGSSVWITCSTEERALNEEVAGRRPTRMPAGAATPEAFHKFTINPAAHTMQDDARILQRSIGTFSEDKCLALAEALAADGTWQVPTLIRMRTQQLADLPEYANDPNHRYLPADLVADWRELTMVFEKLPDATRATLRDLYERQLRLTGIYDQAGTLMMTGTDAGGGWITPGFALHQEFDELASAGVPPLKILQMTTSLPARFLGREATMGAVAAGKAANLVLLDGDPAADAQNLHRVHGVVRAGRYYARPDLDQLLARVETGGGSLR
jgi:imidazolonepropionase-like amidohydrolase